MHLWFGYYTAFELRHFFCVAKSATHFSFCVALPKFCVALFFIRQSGREACEDAKFWASAHLIRIFHLKMGELLYMFPFLKIFK